MLAVSGPVDWLPPVGLLPLQPPEAVQLEALLEVQLSVDAEPLTTLVGLADKETDGRGATRTVTVRLASPPGPTQASMKSVVADSGPVDCVPLVGLSPLQPPDAVQVDAFSAVHASADDSPPLKVVGYALSVTRGVAGADDVTTTFTVLLADPPSPVQLSVKLVVSFSGPVEALPEVLLWPVHPPEAAHWFAFIEFHVSVESSPATTSSGSAVIVIVGGGLAAVTVTSNGGSERLD